MVDAADLKANENNNIKEKTLQNQSFLIRSKP